MVDKNHRGALRDQFQNKMAELERSVDEMIRGLNERYGHLFDISPRRTMKNKGYEPRLPFATPNPTASWHDVESPPPNTPSPPALCNKVYYTSNTDSIAQR